MDMGYCRYCDGVVGVTQVWGTLAEWIREAGIHTWVWVLAVPLTGLGTSGKSLNAFGHQFLHPMAERGSSLWSTGHEGRAEVAVQSEVPPVAFRLEDRSKLPVAQERGQCGAG